MDSVVVTLEYEVTRSDKLFKKVKPKKTKKVKVDKKDKKDNKEKKDKKEVVKVAPFREYMKDPESEFGLHQYKFIPGLRSAWYWYSESKEEKENHTVGAVLTFFNKRAYKEF